uniref:Uncharacterized protein n=1 Tax=Anguilla anguilla TaxID=7936 RepID=A0A0E9PTY6_ANGAN
MVKTNVPKNWTRPLLSSVTPGLEKGNVYKSFPYFNEINHLVTIHNQINVRVPNHH